MTTATKLTLEQFLALPETKPYSEYARGEVLQKPMPHKPHGAIQGCVFMVLYQFLAHGQTGQVFTELRCIFGPPGKERALIPDAVYIAHEHETEGLHHRAAPDLVVEILSPDESTTRLVNKLLYYLNHGVRLVWVIDPDERTTLVLRPGEDGLILAPGDILDGADVLPGFTLPVDGIFAQI